MTDPRHDLGIRGESAVGAWLRQAGWQVLERRWRSPFGELDLVCLDPDATLVGVEVKLRSTSRAGSGAESVDRRRLARLRRALGSYAATTNLRSAAVRLDLVTLEPTADGRWRAVRTPAIDLW
ncbi:MAG TPA: YraN family protein [Candidatus Limnocylindria bacterium]|nr:YraN family protein [Candidatus Limnocylindria bacterium]